MFTLKTKASFDSAHFLAGYEGKCANIHGHRWLIEVTAGGEELILSGPKRGLMIDFCDLKHEVRALAERFDHTLIYEKDSLKPATLEAMNDEGFSMIEVGFRPTAENLARHFYELLKQNGLPVKTVTVYETPDNCASYEVEA